MDNKVEEFVVSLRKVYEEGDVEYTQENVLSDMRDDLGDCLRDVQDIAGAELVVQWLQAYIRVAKEAK